MPRKKTVSLQRIPTPDRKYQSSNVQRLINKSMLDGKKLVAERAVYTALEVAAKKVAAKKAPAKTVAAKKAPAKAATPAKTAAIKKAPAKKAVAKKS